MGSWSGLGSQQGSGRGIQSRLVSGQQLLQTSFSFYRRGIVGTVALRSPQSLRLKELPSLGTRGCVTSRILVCMFAQVPAAAKSSVPAFASYGDP